MVCCGTREEDWERVLELSARFEAVLPMVGLHPWFVAGARPGWADRLEGLLASTGAGLGECGLDFAEGMPERSLQEEAFRIQLRMARALDRPLSIHCRRAWEGLLPLLRETGPPPRGGAVHAYSGSLETARELQDLGLHLSFACGAADPGHRRVRKVLAAVAEDRLLFETDSPDMPPPPLVLNEPAQIGRVRTAAARVRGRDEAALGRTVYEQSWRLFGGMGVTPGPVR
jgi:TatD DNase family protein